MATETERLNTAASELQAALDAYTTALHAYAVEQPNMTVRQLSDYLAQKGWPKRAMDALSKASGRD